MSFVLHLGDCIEGMRALADKSVDHVITDPPYSKDLYARTRTNKGHGKRPNGQAVWSGEGMEGTSAMQLAAMRIGAIDEILDEVAAHFNRIARRWVIVFCDFEIAHRWQAALSRYVRTGAWVKTNPMPQVTGDRPAAGFEPCVIAHPSPGRMRWNGGQGRHMDWSQLPERRAPGSSMPEAGVAYA